ncbi:MAG: DUF1028 domain-containing protein [Dehalococcoidia bacterium]|nr:DUF1028 domain-containing protein [Dehalococcoidia bacterium]
MTFSILGRDPKTGELGISIATYSLAVGATCPRILSGIGVVTSQASTNPAIAEEIMELIEDGIEPLESFMQALANDDHPEFRQVALLLPEGDALVHSGKNIKSSSGNVNGENCTAVGNFLDNDDVLKKMAAEFENPRNIEDANPSIADRLICALEAGKKAGGQSGSNGAHLPERSACLMIGSPGENFPIDVRVDASENAIADLRSAYDAYMPMHEFYLKRAEDPTDLPSQDDWVNSSH